MKQGDQENKINNSDEVSVADFFAKIRSLFRYLKNKWRLILLIGFLGAGIGVLYSIITKPVYTATCTFVLEEGNKSGGLGQYAGLASLAGIDVSGGGGGIFQGDNILELYRSRTMIEKALLSTADFNGKNELLIDKYVNFNKLRSRWKKKDGIDSITFIGPPEKFNRKQDSLITDLVEIFNKKVLSVYKPDIKLSIIRVEVATTDELFAKEFTDKLVETVNNFYVQTKTKKELQNVHILQYQLDSVRAVLNTSIEGVASAIDAAPNANPALLTLRVPSQKRQVDVQASSAVYAEIVKNYELAQMSLRQDTPLIQVIDRPVLPLLIDRVTKLKGIITGAILGILFIVILLTGRKVTSKLARG